MPHIDSQRRKFLTATLVLVLLSLLLAACGSSSKSSSSSTSTSASAATSTAPGGAAAASRFTALRECLAKNGITLPKRPAGQRRGGFLGGGTGPVLPKGVTRAQYEAALKKCGGFSGGGVGGRGRFNSPAFRTALAKFATCVREHGVKLPEPNTSGKGPVFNTNGIDTNSTQFKTAEAACSSILRSAIPGRVPGGGAPGAGAAGGVAQ